MKIDEISEQIMKSIDWEKADRFDRIAFGAALIVMGKELMRRAIEEEQTKTKQQNNHGYKPSLH